MPERPSGKMDEASERGRWMDGGGEGQRTREEMDWGGERDDVEMDGVKKDGELLRGPVTGALSEQNVWKSSVAPGTQRERRGEKQVSVINTLLALTPHYAGPQSHGSLW